MDYSVDDKDSESGPFGCLFFVFIILLVFLNWMIVVPFTVSIGILYFFNKKESVFAKVLFKTTLPIAIGLGIVFLIVLLVEFGGTSDVSILNDRETWLIKQRLKFLPYVDLGFFNYFVILLSVIMLNYVLPNLNLFSKFTFINTHLSALVVIINTVLTFTFFAQIPADDLIQNEYENLSYEYEILIRRDNKAVGQFIAAQIVESQIPNLTIDQRKDYLDFFSQIMAESDVLGKELRDFKKRSRNEPIKIFELNAFRELSDRHPVKPERVTASLAKKHANSTGELYITRNNSNLHRLLNEFSQRNIGLTFFAKQPISNEERNQSLREFRKKQSQVLVIESKSNETVTGVRDIFVKTITSGIPNLESVAGSYIKAFISETSKYLFDNYLERNLHLTKRISSFESFVKNLNLKEQILKIDLLKFGNNEISSEVPEIRQIVKKEFREQERIRAEEYQEYRKVEAARQKARYKSTRVPRARP